MQARTSQTETAVLGALSVEPMTGYALREAIRDVLGHFWSESFGQIYPTLADARAPGPRQPARLDEAGRSTFAITASGTGSAAGASRPADPGRPRLGTA